MFCRNCGMEMAEGAVFCAHCGTGAAGVREDRCVNCGAAITAGDLFCSSCGAAGRGEAAASSPAGSPGTPGMERSPHTGLVGFSERYRSPEILATARKNRKFGRIFMLFLVLAPLVGFPLAGLLSDGMPMGEAVIIGVGISLVMLIVNLFALRRSRAPIWEGTVVNKNSERKYRHGGDTETYMEYTVVITTDGGKKRTIVEEGSRRYMYDYLSPGDRVRYHSVFGTYEKYDKSRDRVIYCNVCRMMNPINNDRCKRCNNLLFK